MCIFLFLTDSPKKSLWMEQHTLLWLIQQPYHVLSACLLSSFLPPLPTTPLLNGRFFIWMIMDWTLKCNDSHTTYSSSRLGDSSKHDLFRHLKTKTNTSIDACGFFYFSPTVPKNHHLFPGEGKRTTIYRKRRTNHRKNHRKTPQILFSFWIHFFTKCFINFNSLIMDPCTFCWEDPSCFT